MDDLGVRPGPVEWIGTRFETTLRGEESGGAMSMIDVVAQPGFSPPRHIHHDADEAFAILTGDAEFWVAGERFVRGPGEVAFVPRGVEHTFRVVSEIPCRHLTIFTPANMECFFEEMGARGLRIPQDMEAVVAAGGRFEMTFTGPPLSDAEVGA